MPIQTREQFIDRVKAALAEEIPIETLMGNIFDNYVLPNNEPCKRVAYEAFVHARETVDMEELKQTKDWKTISERNKKAFEEYWIKTKIYGTGIAQPKKIEELDLTQVEQIADLYGVSTHTAVQIYDAIKEIAK